MNENKSNKGLFIILIIIIVVLACGFGYELSLNLSDDSKNVSNDVSIKTTESVNTPSVSDVMKTLAGTWTWKSERFLGYDENNEECFETITLTLNEDGTYEIGHGALGCAEYYEGSGKYYLNDNELYLINDKCPYEVVEGTDYMTTGNCFNTYILDYSDGSISYNGNILTLKK